MSYTLILRHILHIFSTCIHKFATTLFTFPNFSITLAKFWGGDDWYFKFMKLHSRFNITAVLPYFIALHFLTKQAKLIWNWNSLWSHWWSNGHIDCHKCQPSIAHYCIAKDRSGFAGTSLQFLTHGCRALTFVTSSGLTQVPTVLS